MLTRLLIAAMFLAGVSCAPPAVADPTETATLEHGTTVCAMMDRNPTETGLENSVYYLMKLGYDLHTAADIAVLAIHGMCPDYLPIVARVAGETVPILASRPLSSSSENIGPVIRAAGSSCSSQPQFVPAKPT